MRFKGFLLEQTDRKFKVYLDMDGVLTDFREAFKKIDGRTTQQVEKEGDEAFWEHVKKGGLEFWSHMPWMKDGKKLWNYVKNKDVAILSAPARRLPDSVKGKQIWIGREMGNVDTYFSRAKNKKDYANKGSILVDDLAKNIKQWESAGGIGILHKSASQTIKKFKELGV